MYNKVLAVTTFGAFGTVLATAVIAMFGNSMSWAVGIAGFAMCLVALFVALAVPAIQRRRRKGGMNGEPD